MGARWFTLLAVAFGLGMFTAGLARTWRVERRLRARLRRRVDDAAMDQRALQLELDRARRMEAHLRESEDFSRALFAAAHAGLLVVDLTRRQILDSNPAAQVILGGPDDDLVGRVVEGPLAAALGMVADGQEAAATEPASATVEIIDGRGATRTCIRRITRLAEGEGDLAVVSLLDISEQKATEAELRESWARLNEANVMLKRHKDQVVRSEKLASIGQLAAGVAHEINNPVGYVTSNLGTVRGYVATMRALLLLYAELAAAPGDGELAARIETLRREEDIDFILEDLDGLVSESLEGVGRVAEIVKNLKSFAREDTLELKEQDLNEIVESMLRMTWNELKYKCQVERAYGEVPPLRCNAGRLAQVFMNMLVNAGQAIPESGGTIRVGTGVEGDHAFVTIADDGCGMDPATAGRIFDPFFTTKDVGKGTGLGLSISHGIVGDHGGRIEVESAPGKGTLFRILLPLERVAAGGDLA